MQPPILADEESPAQEMADEESPAQEMQPPILADEESPAQEMQPPILADEESPAQEMQPPILADEESPAQEMQPPILADEESPAQEMQPCTLPSDPCHSYHDNCNKEMSMQEVHPTHGQSCSLCDVPGTRPRTSSPLLEQPSTPPLTHTQPLSTGGVGHPPSSPDTPCSRRSTPHPSPVPSFMWLIFNLAGDHLGFTLPDECRNFYRSKNKYCYLDFSKKADCIKRYRHLQYTKHVTHFHGNLQNMFVKLQTEIANLFKDIIMNNKGKKQYAWAVLVIDDGSFHFFKPEYPQKKSEPLNKYDSARTKHSEDILIDHIKEEIKNSKKVYTELYIYSVNSPCIGRKDHDPCIINLTELSNHLGEEYSIKTYIGFSQFYGSGNLYKYLPYLFFCNYKIPSDIEKLVNEVQKKKKYYRQRNGKFKEVCNELNDLLLKYLEEVVTTKFSFKPNTSILLSSLQNTLTNEQENTKQYIGREITAKIGKICSVTATLSELKEMVEEKYNELFGDNIDPCVSQHLKYTFFKCWGDDVNKLINDSIGGHINEQLVHVWIEIIKCIPYHPTIVHVGFL
ncbi:uncharacterized protein LOC121688801 isoform X2 [Alosa sapidissima]|nr:uncharacterized protein LOC121688801 isoform X2 [Alosa sapidissima]